MVVSSRIKTIGDFIKPGEVVVDVGADHGLLELYLLAKSPEIQITAVENKVGPYKILETSLIGLKNVNLSLSDGITVVNENTTTVVIAGMGGLNIKNILDAYPEKVKNLKKIVIDAHRDIQIARKTIVDYGFRINHEKIVYEQEKFYIVIEFLKANEPKKYSDEVLEFGYQIYNDELWPKYRDYLIETNNQTIEKIKDLTTMQDRVLSLKKMNERLENYGKN